MRSYHFERAKRILIPCVIFWGIVFGLIYLVMGGFDNATYEDIEVTALLILLGALAIVIIVVLAKIIGIFFSLIATVAIFAGIAELDVVVNALGYAMYLIVGVTGIAIVLGIYHIIRGFTARE